MEALSLAANIISVVHVTSELIERLNDFKNTIDGLPRALQAISNELPTLRLTLKKVSEAIQDGRVTEDSQEALKPLITDFEEQICSIAEIVEKMKPRNPSRMTRNLKAVTSFRYDSRIKYHEGVIRGYASTLSLERVVSGPGKDLAGMHLSDSVVAVVTASNRVQPYSPLWFPHSFVRMDKILTSSNVRCLWIY
jgi:hypothetical protein